MVLVEFAGGILWNKREKKAVNDLQKIEKGVIDFMELTNLPIGYFIRYHGKYFFLLLNFFLINLCNRHVSLFRNDQQCEQCLYKENTLLFAVPYHTYWIFAFFQTNA